MYKRQNWQPLPDYLERAIKQESWDISQVQLEKERLTKELNNSYRLLISFAKERIDKTKRDSEELVLLGRKLNAAFEKRPSKLERSTIKNTQTKQEARVVLKRNELKNEQTNWSLSRLDINHQERFIRQAHSLINLLAWSVDYGVLGEKTKIALNPGESHITSREVAQTLNEVVAFFNGLPETPANLDAYRYAPLVTDVLLVINSGLDSMSDFTEKGINLTSERSDALSFGSQRRNLVHSIDMMFRNSWNEIIVATYNSIAGLMVCLCEVFDRNTLGAGQVLPTLRCASYNSPRALSVAKRIQALFAEAAAIFKRYSEESSPRFITQVGHSFCVMQVKDQKMTAIEVAEAGLIKALSAAQPIFSPVYFDRRVDQKGLLPVIYGRHKAGYVQLYYVCVSNTKAHIYILDEKGSLFFKEQSFIHESSLLQTYKELIGNVFYRRGLIAYEQNNATFDLDIECYKAEKIRQHWGLEKVPVTDRKPAKRLDVRVVYDGQTKQAHIYCNEQLFSGLDYGDKLYSEVSAFIRQERKSAANYSVYLTDIDVPYEELGVSSYAQLQTIHYLNYKQNIEEKLNI